MANALKRKKIAFLTDADASNRRLHSGTPYYVSFLLNEHCGDVTFIDNLIQSQITIWFILKNWFAKRSYLLLAEYLKSKLWRCVGRRYDWRMSLNASIYCASKVEPKLRKTRYDLIWVEKSCTALANLRTDIPVVYESDATFRAMVDYYPWFTGLSKSALRHGDELERRALQKADIVILTAEWAKISAVRDYGIDATKIHVIPSPPNWDRVPQRETVLREKSSSACTLLFIGVDWQRKGGDIAVAVVEELNRLGTRSRLLICGCTPPKRYKGNPHLEVIGYLDKNAQSDRTAWERLFLKSHFFILPTRAECMGISFSEAAAFGLPLVATDTGGVSTVVKHGRNGFLFGQDESPSSIAIAIKELWDDKKRYLLMRRESRRFYDETLSAESWAASVNKILAGL